MAETTSVRGQQCATCDRVNFPPHMICCAGCGGMDFGSIELREGTVEAVTTVRRAAKSGESVPDDKLCGVRVTDTCRFIARLEGEADTEDIVELAMLGDAVVATPRRF